MAIGDLTPGPAPNQDLNISGIYVITCLANGKIYIGSAVLISKRWREHRNFLRKGKHQNRYLQSAWEKYGEAGFEWRIIEVATTDRLIEREQYWMDYYESYVREKGFNISLKAESRLGVKMSEESKAKISRWQKGRPKSPEHTAKMTATVTGKPKSPEHCARISASKKGTTYSPEARARMSVAMQIRYQSPEARAKSSAAQQGRTHSPETKAKMTASAKARWLWQKQLKEYGDFAYEDSPWRMSEPDAL